MSYSLEINKLVSDGSKAYSQKNYELASEKYGDACQLYSKQHNNKEDGDLLLLYGKALFQNGVSKSSILGGIDTTTTNQETTKEEEVKNEGVDKEVEDIEEDDKFQFYDAEPIDGEVVNEEVEEEVETKEEEADEENKDNIEGEGKENEEEEQPEETNDFEMAWMILDVARGIFEDKLKTLEKPKNIKEPYIKSESDPIDNDYIINLKKLSETYDILGEVSLESENFPQSALDLQKSLDLRLELYPKNSSPISESHYKLSLALEFCTDDPNSRQKAAEQIKLAIESTKERNLNEKDTTKRKDNEEMINELNDKYQELIKDPNQDIQQEQLDIIKGILGESLSGGDTAGATDAIVNNLTSLVKKRQPQNEGKVNDLSDLVKKKKPKK
ncbi:uncharacterized protein KGF55_000862 [Candida pseudojiufengensis]|uniref:uncharacterized protein n=1 Tax=Candida pseudojiufengensis TaxID=497109 RepID=UPI0022253BC4|nr:uncharacterized protein KGF55_000862 [Candida pseudojiufengensis]KAI5966553.1 hypothetical protein KGF55_000862 [Candida pseudojiufengensis]